MTLEVNRDHRLPQTEYFAEPQAKSGIALHHTVCDSARTTLDIWRRDKTDAGTPRRVATAYVVDPDGTIYEAFDPACWAWQFGVQWSRPERFAFERRFIGIEITSEGGLMEHEGRLYAYDRAWPVFEKARDEALECRTPYRGYRWFDRYEPEQLRAVALLVDELCSRFDVPRVYPDRPYLYYGTALKSFEGVIGHAMVRADKSDPAPDPRLWKTLEHVAGLHPAPVGAPPGPPDAPLSRLEIEELLLDNITRLDTMDVAAGSLVKALLMELERRDVYLTLDTPPPDSHAVEYTVTQGDPRDVARIARALGFRQATPGRLEVSDA